MYEIRCVVADNKLRDTLIALKGNTLEQPIVNVIDEMPRNETYKQAPQRPTGGYSTVSTNDGRKPYKRLKQNPKMARFGQRSAPHHQEGGVEKVLRDLITRSGVERISAREMRDATLAQGYRPGAYSHGVKKLLDDGTLMPDGDLHGGYRVARRAAEAA